MELINISVKEKEILQNLSVPSGKEFSRSIPVDEMPKLQWSRIAALGFGTETDKGNVNAETENEILNEAASVFSACAIPFSLLCERKNDNIVYAIGFEKEKTAKSLLKSVFGTVKTEEYTPCFTGKEGMYAHSFKPIKISTEDTDKKDAVKAIHASKWADAVAKILTDFPGMVRLDFYPLSENACKELISDVRKISDDITAYLECSIQGSDNVSLECKDNIIENVKKYVSGDSKCNKSSGASVSWKRVSSELSDLKKETEHYIRLFTEAEKQGWIVEMVVSANTGLGEQNSAEVKEREEVLSAAISSAVIKAGYTCDWDRCDALSEKKEDRTLLLPAASAKELVSFPAASFYGFERVKNCCYNVNLPDIDKAVPFAKLMQYDEKTGIDFKLPEKEMNRHTFVCGMTGSGKTNSVHHLLSSVGKFPYLVIEPVKGEYHSLPEVKNYTMTAGSDKALYLNPFWFPKGSSLQYHIDYLKQIISSAFDLYAAMPNILEQCLVLVYQHCGWDFIQNENRYVSELPEEMLYPTFSDLCQEVEAYITKSNFSEELKGNYRGALLSRLQSFTSGPKGMLLNTSKHLSCEELSEKRVVISLDSLADDADKSIVMGIIIAQYYEYLKSKCVGSTKKELQHLVVIEEAHHLFAGDAAASASSAEGGSRQNSSQGLVKTLNNMLAEIRAYGEGFIIVDQSPSALHPSVLKNTGIKVAHRIDYGKDIDVMRDVLLLDKEDLELAMLKQGQALIHFGGMRSSAKVQVPECKSKEESVILERENISGNSIVSTLMDDSELSKYIHSAVIDRVINHLLYDELENCGKIHHLLCDAIKTAMIKYGHSEMLEKISQNDILAEYIASLLPKRLEEIFPKQYCTCKMICMYIKRFLMLASETSDNLSKTELAAFASYRTHRITPRLLEFFEYSDIKEYKSARAIIGNSPDLNLICNITTDLVKLNVSSDNLEKIIRSLLLEYYYFCEPKQIQFILSRAVGMLSYRRKEQAC